MEVADRFSTLLVKHGQAGLAGRILSTNTIRLKQDPHNGTPRPPKRAAADVALGRMQKDGPPRKQRRARKGKDNITSKIWRRGKPYEDGVTRRFGQAGHLITTWIGTPPDISNRYVVESDRGETPADEEGSCRSGDEEGRSNDDDDDDDDEDEGRSNEDEEPPAERIEEEETPAERIEEEELLAESVEDSNIEANASEKNIEEEKQRGIADKA